MQLNYYLQPGDRVRPRGVRAKERGRVWTGTVVSVDVAYPVGSQVPYRTLTVESDLGETWVADERDWLPEQGPPLTVGPRYLWLGPIRIGWYDVGVWAGVLFILTFIVLTLPCGLILGGVPLVMILWSYHQDRRRENLWIAAKRKGEQ